jgi:AcrR family transcriptional regulator
MPQAALSPEHENAKRILQEGWILFQQKGYRGATLDELCARCGITKPTLYYYFHDKETLFVQVLSHQLHGFHVTIEQPGPLAVRLERITVAILDSFQTEYTTLLRDREHIHASENQLAVREAFRAELFDPLAELMRAGIASGELHPERPHTLVLIFLGMVNSFIHRAEELNLDNQALAGLLIGYFLNGAATASAQSIQSQPRIKVNSRE